MEGGFGGEPWSEAHGGYTFCAVAALQLMNQLEAVDIPALRGWLVRRQMSYEGGFQGRSNKLVDGCYSFWQGGALAILSSLYNKSKIPTTTDPWLHMHDDDNNDTTNNTSPFLLFQEEFLQRYILLCAQDINGGLRDKPSKTRDFYHSCYNLSGLSVSQHCGKLRYGHSTESSVAATHPVYNIRRDRVDAMLRESL
uniref:Prenyltransferase alpha-alpha toroid domain-containing protein n=1 Tax=Cyclophora tenuis TaxID=216820 RepID=A0A7S1DBW7_CYCTE